MAKKSIAKGHIILLVIVAVLVVAVAVATPTIAYYIRKANDVGGDVDLADSGKPTIIGGNSSFTFNKEKEEIKNVSVKVEDEGYPVYVRAYVIVTWQKTVNGEPVDHWTQPEQGTGKDYTISYNETDWQKEGNFYYFKNPVVSGGTTASFIDSCVLLTIANMPEGYSFNVEVIVQTIQAIGTGDNGEFGWREAWNLGDNSGIGWQSTPSTGN